MQCTSPITAWRLKSDCPGITFTKRNAALDTEFAIPCGRCIGCKVNKSREWAIRCHFEAREHAENSFITLTYDPEHLPVNGSLDIRDFQIFMRRLRKSLDKKISYFACGEYGYDENQPTKLGRPHFHALIFGHQFPDIEPVGLSHNGSQRYKSQTLAQIWGMGNIDVGDVTLQSAGYVARYTTKKQSGGRGAKHYVKICPITGEYHNVLPEMLLCSKKPAIGLNWYNKYKTDLQKGYIVVQGDKCPIPKYYKKLLDLEDNINWQLNKRNQSNKCDPTKTNSWEQMDTVRKIQQNKSDRLIRNQQ